MGCIKSVPTRTALEVNGALFGRRMGAAGFGVSSEDSRHAFKAQQCAAILLFGTMKSCSVTRSHLVI
jgi:hypothetical protein